MPTDSPISNITKVTASADVPLTYGRRKQMANTTTPSNNVYMYIFFNTMDREEKTTKAQA